MNKLALYLITLYQKTLSPDKGLFSPRLKGKVCSHEPHCSEYAKQCFQTYGFRDALVYSFDRIISCTPSSMIQKDPSTYNVVFFSGAHIGVPFLKALYEDPRFSISGVVTMPDVARDRGQKVQENIIKTTAKKLGLSEKSIHTPSSLRTSSKKYKLEAQATKDRLISLDADYFVVVAYGKLLPKEILEIPRLGPINVHGSLLPEYRGASPLQSVFLDAKEESGITIMLMDEGMDTGNMISKCKTSLSLSWTVKDLIKRIETHAPNHLMKSLWEFGKGDISSRPQDEDLASHCKKIEKEDGLIDIYTDSLGSVYSKFQAYALRPKIYFTFPHPQSGKQKRAIIEQIQVDEQTYGTSNKEAFLDTDSQGKIILHKSILNLSIKPEGKKAITWSEFQHNYLTK